MENLQLAIGLWLVNLLLALWSPEASDPTATAAPPRVEAKSAALDLGAWRYEALPATTGDFEHRFYRLPSTRPGAPVMLLLHGVNLDGRTFLNVAPLRDTWELIAYELPEASPLYRGEIDDFVLLLDDFMAARRLERVWLGGVSFGGVVALRFAATHPAAQVPALLLISSPLSGYDDRERSTYRDIHRWLETRSDRDVAWLMEQVTGLYRVRLESPQREELAPLMRIKRPAFYRQVIAALRAHRGVLDTKAVKVPVLVIKGSEDLLVPDVQVRRFQRHIPHAEAQIVAGATHSMAYLRGAETARRIEDFCRRQGVLPGAVSATRLRRRPAAAPRPAAGTAPEPPRGSRCARAQRTPR